MPFRIALELNGVILTYKTSDLFDRHENRMPYGTFGEPVPGVKEALKELKADGWEIIILTTRADRATVRGHLKNKLKLDFDALASPTRALGYDVLVSAGGVCFNGNWTKALADIAKLKSKGTWEERRLRGKAEKGLHPDVKGFL